MIILEHKVKKKQKKTTTTTNDQLGPINNHFIAANDQLGSI